MELVKVKRLNRVLEVPESRLDVFLQQGYDQIDEKGKVLKRATGGREVSLAEYNRALEEIENLKAENKKLKSEITKLKKSE